MPQVQGLPHSGLEGHEVGLDWWELQEIPAENHLEASEGLLRSKYLSDQLPSFLQKLA